MLVKLFCVLFLANYVKNSCEIYTCNGNLPCPYNIQNYDSFKIQCPNGKQVLLKTNNWVSSQDDLFIICVMNKTSYDSLDTGTSYCYKDVSSDKTSCFTHSETNLFYDKPMEIYIVVSCQNTLLNCAMRYKTEYECVDLNPTIIPTITPTIILTMIIIFIIILIVFIIYRKISRKKYENMQFQSESNFYDKQEMIQLDINN